MTKYIFSAGTARGGTGLLAHMLSAHPSAKIVSDPLLALYKSFRNAVVIRSGETFKDEFDLQSPLSDNYFTRDRRQVLALMEKSTVDIPFDQGEWDKLRPVLEKRARLASADIVGHINEISGNTYKEIFESSLELFKKIRSGDQELDWIGIHENWTIEFFIPLAKSFQTAKFVTIIRDPRAVFTSNTREKDQTLVGDLVSYGRSHRKLMACATYYKTLPLFNGRLMVMRYEDLVTDPEDSCRSLCNFLEIPFSEDMLDTNKYINHATGGIHDGLSNYETNAQGFSQDRINRWKKYLAPERADLMDFVCGPEMTLFNYPTINVSPLSSNHTACLDTLVNEMSGHKAWRCDFQDPVQDYGFELLRRELLKSNRACDDDIIKRCFLFPEVYTRIKELVSQEQL